ncbi:MAG: hypothetical protein HC863_03160 [Myxococcales bacterium]|nr:hypothetical protein [Myxococcales bacterium]
MREARELAGTVTVLGVPMRGVQILCATRSKVLASTMTDQDGQFRAVAAGAEFVVARFTEPFVGCVAQPVSEVGASVEISVERADIVRLSGHFELPAEVAFDWADLKLTPRLDVPPVVVLWELEGLREAFWSRRMVQPTFEVRVLRGTWELRAAREIDAPMALSRPVNLGVAQVTLEDGSAPAPRFGGYEFVIAEETSVTVSLQTI